MRGSSTLPAGTAPAVAIRSLRARYHARTAVNDVSLDCRGGAVTAIIGPSGCGKSTLLRCINRLHETVAGAAVSGAVLLDGSDVYAREVNPVELRRRIGMVFQRPTPFPALSVFDNVAAGLRAGPGRPGRTETADAVEGALRRASLWNEVRDRLHGSALALSGGQQQRLCIARALAVGPSVLLLDEPTASLDPLGTQRIEELLYELRQSVTVVVVTHNMQQAARISDVTIFMLAGQVVEHGVTGALFTTPGDPRTEAYITGRFG
ncbi:MAG: phosphate ABC transporter ATP-binding protein [Gemmatimonadota bacterium]